MQRVNLMGAYRKVRARPCTSVQSCTDFARTFQLLHGLSQVARTSVQRPCTSVVYMWVSVHFRHICMRLSRIPTGPQVKLHGWGIREVSTDAAQMLHGHARTLHGHAWMHRDTSRARRMHPKHTQVRRHVLNTKTHDIAGSSPCQYFQSPNTCWNLCDYIKGNTAMCTLRRQEVNALLISTSTTQAQDAPNIATTKEMSTGGKPLYNPEQSQGSNPYPTNFK